MNVGLTKGQLRTILLARLRGQSEQQREEKSALIAQQLLQEEEFVKAKRIMFYRAFDGEVKTEKMMYRARQLGKEIYVPVCDQKQRILKPCYLQENNTWEIGPYKTWEPKEKELVTPDILDLIVTPGLAFDRDGNRLGRGKGYYDRFLAGLPDRIDSIGLAFDFQIVSNLPTESSDICVKKTLFA